MEHYITWSELLLLLVVFWLPIFLLAMFPQRKFLASLESPAIWLVAAVVVEFALGVLILLSPLHRYFLNLDFLGGYAIGSVPLQAEILAAIIVTFVIWVIGRHAKQAAH